MVTTTEAAETIRSSVRPLTGGRSDYDPLLDLVGDARVVLLGEATHGTHEFYVERARITRRLIEELTTALRPLDRVGSWDHQGAPETYPFEL